MVVASQFAGLVEMEPLRRRQGALVWRNNQVLLLLVQGSPAQRAVSGKMESLALWGTTLAPASVLYLRPNARLSCRGRLRKDVEGRKTRMAARSASAV